MSRGRSKSGPQAPGGNANVPEKSGGAPAKNAALIPPAVDVVDGIPDRAAGRPKWIYLLLAGIYVAWLAFLAYCAAAGSAG